MQEKVLTIPELILIAGTRVAFGVGIGLLLADKFTGHERKGAIAMNVLGKSGGVERGSLMDTGR